jgi:hypothetical protein
MQNYFIMHALCMYRCAVEMQAQACKEPRVLPLAELAAFAPSMPAQAGMEPRGLPLAELAA